MVALSALDHLGLAIVEQHAEALRADPALTRLLTVARRQHMADTASVMRCGEVPSVHAIVGDLDEHVARTVHARIGTRGDADVSRGTVAISGGTYAYVGAPVQLPSGAPFGTVAVYAEAPCAGVTRADAGTIELLAALASDMLGPQAVGHHELAAAQERTLRAIDNDIIDMVFQPLHDLGTGAVIGYEAFSRFQDGPDSPTPDRWFADARSVGLGAELEAMAVRKALAIVPSLPQDVHVAVNVSAAALGSTEIEAALAGTPADRVVVEITDDEEVELEVLAASLERLRERGIRFAMDDLGGGYAGLQRILQLRPDILKLDRGLVADVNDDAAKAAMVTATVVLAARLGTTLVAEGVETVAEAFALRLLGVSAAQGWHYGRPVPAGQIATRTTDIS